MAAPKGNKFACKPANEKKCCNINIRVNPIQLESWKDLALKCNKTFTQWIIDKLNG